MKEKKIEVLLNEYAESHQNKTNKLIHWICVPAIFFSIFGMIRAIPLPGFFEDFSSYMNWANLILILVLIYYLFLSVPLFLGFIFWGLFVSFGNEFLFQLLGTKGLLWLSLGIFALAWVGQFIGHGIEGKKPSFFKDLQFLLIGPAWLMNFIFGTVKLKASEPMSKSNSDDIL